MMLQQREIKVSFTFFLFPFLQCSDKLLLLYSVPDLCQGLNHFPVKLITKSSFVCFTHILITFIVVWSCGMYFLLIIFEMVPWLIPTWFSDRSHSSQAQTHWVKSPHCSRILYSFEKSDFLLVRDWWCLCSTIHHQLQAIVS